MSDAVIGILVLLGALCLAIGLVLGVVELFRSDLPIFFKFAATGISCVVVALFVTMLVDS